MKLNAAISSSTMKLEERLIRVIEYVEEHLSSKPDLPDHELLRVLETGINAFKAIGSGCPNDEILRYVSVCIRICHELEVPIRRSRRIGN